jgi:Polysaccharide pyruvyl transferase
VVLLNDCSDQVNFGARALVDGLLQGLADAMPGATVQPIPSHWLLDTTYGLGMFVDGGRAMVQPPAVFPEVADQFECLGDDWLEGRAGPGAEEFLVRLRGADVVVLNGEGSLYRTNLSAIRELFLGWLAKTRLGIPTVFLNGTVHLTGVIPTLPAMVRKTFAELDAVAVREAPSFRNLTEFAPGLPVQLIPDSAFILDPSDTRQPPEMERILDHVRGRPYFCFDPGPMPMDGTAGRRSALYELISRLQEIVPEAVFIRNNPPDRFIRTVAEETGSIYFDTIVDYRQWMAVAAGAHFLVSGRYHNTILASMVGCPTVALGSTSHKVHGVCELLDGVLGRPYDGTDLRCHIGAIAQQARDYVARRDDYATRLREVCEARRTEAGGLGALVQSALRASDASRGALL